MHSRFQSSQQDTQQQKNWTTTAYAMPIYVPRLRESPPATPSLFFFSFFFFSEVFPFIDPGVFKNWLPPPTPAGVHKGSGTSSTGLPLVSSRAGSRHDAEGLDGFEF